MSKSVQKTAGFRTRANDRRLHGLALPDTVINPSANLRLENDRSSWWLGGGKRQRPIEGGVMAFEQLGSFAD